MAITLRQLECFVAVVAEGSFTRAADLLHVTQPGLSHQFQALEREVGGPLLERLPRKVRLTPAGRAMLPHARASLAHADLAGAAARRASGAMAGPPPVAPPQPNNGRGMPAAPRAPRAAYARPQGPPRYGPPPNRLLG